MADPSLRPRKPSLLGRLGPGLITGAADDDPGGVATHSQAGAAFGFNMLWSLVLAYPLLAFSPVHADGLGATVGKPTDNDVWITIGIGAGLAFLLMLGKGLFVAILAPLAVLASAWFTSHWVARRLGGYTGDTLGAVQQKAEVVFLVVAALFIGS
jgi:adenosylcobinamide-GDP ribazoletransferase